jgi:glycosyltransferase involved in cell wall biosynthesis
MAGPELPRVLQVLTCDAPGGTEEMVATLVERADPARVRVELVTLAAPGPIAARLAASGIRVRSLGGTGTLPTLRRLAGIVARERFDVVSAYGLTGTMLCRVLVRLLSRQTRFVHGVRGLHLFDTERVDGVKLRLVLVLERLASRLVDVYDANSRGALDLLARAGIAPGKLHYIPNGIETTGYPLAARGGDPPTVVCVARMVPIKRHVDLLAAAEKLASADVPFRLALVGSGPIEAECRTAARPLGDRVAFYGVLDRARVLDLLAGSDVFCLMSLAEGMPGSVMEAMACGLPVVGTCVNGVQDLVVDGETGFLVPPRDPAALAQRLGILLADAGLRRRMGEAGRNRIAEHFTLDGMLRAKEQLYRDLAAA